MVDGGWWMVMVMVMVMVMITTVELKGRWYLSGTYWPVVLYVDESRCVLYISDFGERARILKVEGESEGPRYAAPVLS